MNAVVTVLRINYGGQCLSFFPCFMALGKLPVCQYVHMPVPSNDMFASVSCHYKRLCCRNFHFYRQ